MAEALSPCVSFSTQFQVSQLTIVISFEQCGYYGHHPAYCESLELLDAAEYYISRYERAIAWYENFLLLPSNGACKKHHTTMIRIFSAMTRLGDIGLEVLNGGSLEAMRLEHACQSFDIVDFQKEAILSHYYDDAFGPTYDAGFMLDLWHEADNLCEEVLLWAECRLRSASIGQLEADTCRVQYKWADWVAKVEHRLDLHLESLKEINDNDDEVRNLLSELYIKLGKMMQRGSSEYSRGVVTSNACSVQVRPILPLRVRLFLSRFMLTSSSNQ